MENKCEADGCRNAAIPDAILCHECWRLLPIQLRVLIEVHGGNTMKDVEHTSFKEFLLNTLALLWLNAERGQLSDPDIPVLGKHFFLIAQYAGFSEAKKSLVRRM